MDELLSDILMVLVVDVMVRDEEGEGVVVEDGELQDGRILFVDLRKEM